MTMSKGMRQFHRWTSMFFVASVIATTIAMSQKEPLVWISYVPLLPLALLTITGLYLYALPHWPKRKAA